MFEDFYSLRFDLLPEWFKRKYNIGMVTIDLPSSEYEVVSSIIHPEPKPLQEKNYNFIPK